MTQSAQSGCDCARNQVSVCVRYTFRFCACVASTLNSCVQVVYHWAKGKSFKEICEHNMPAGVMEGDVVRSINRLEQACQDLMSAARVMGNTDLFEQFEEASKLIKRDIVFAGSLYVFK